VTEWTSAFSLLSGGTLIGGSVLLWRLYWPNRLRYLVLGVLLGVWVMYPSALPDRGLLHPLSYGLVLAVPLVVGYILWHDAREVLGRAFSRRLPIVSAGLAAMLFGAFFLNANGMLDIIRSDGGVSTAGVGVVLSMGDPLVVWPALRYSLPTVALSGFISVGMLVVSILLAGLVGVNVGVATVPLQHARLTSSSGLTAMGGVLAAAGATVCVSCAPVAVGVLTAGTGITLGPLFWALSGPGSLLEAVFIVGSVLLLTGGTVRSARLFES
jgi:hypothetical protein